MEHHGPRRWLVAGIALLVVGAASLAAVVVLGGGDDGERPVGKLIDQTGLAAAPADTDEGSTPTSSPFPTELTRLGSGAGGPRL